MVDLLKTLIHEKIFNVMNDVEYMPKDGKIEFGKTKYNYLSAEQIVTNIRKEMIKQKLIIYPCGCLTDNTVGSAKDITITYRILAIEDGSFIDVQVTGGGYDSTDKKSYKALTGAYKYALRQTFMIETGDNDPDKTPSGKTVKQTKPKALTETQIKKLFVEYHKGDKGKAKEDYDLFKDFDNNMKQDTIDKMLEEVKGE